MTAPWIVRMRWLDLLFAHWPIDAEALAETLPAGLDLDMWDGRAWLGIVPFTMADVAPRGCPAVPRFSTFPELNVRTYVRHGGIAGVWFLSLDAMSWPTVHGARRVFHLPYVHARMRSMRVGDLVTYVSKRDDPNAVGARFEARFRPTGPVRQATPGSFEDWATNRMRLFSCDHHGGLWRSEIAHAAWPLQTAEAVIDAAELADAHGLTLPDRPPHLLYARRLDVHGWLPVRD